MCGHRCNVLLASFALMGILSQVPSASQAEESFAQNRVTLKKGDRIVFLGDSLTYLAGKELPKEHVTKGFVRIVREALKERHPEKQIEVDWVSTGGGIVQTLLKLVNEKVMAKKPTIVVIQIGCNDARWISEREFENGLEELVDRLKTAGIQVVQCTLTAVGEKHDGSNPDDKNLEIFAATARKVATAKKVPLIDLRKAFLAHWKEHNPKNEPTGILTYDGNHFNDAGHRLVAEQMLMKFK